jgi:membrane protease YdiL (CAAX protease family)
MGAKARRSQSQVKAKVASDVSLPAFHSESSEERQVKAMETRQRTSFRAFIKGHAVLTFYILVFALQGGLYLIAFLGTGYLATGPEEPTSPADLGPLQYLASLPGPLIVAMAAILVIALAFGRVGLRDLRSRLFRWRVGIRWYAVALLTAPLLMTAILYALSLTSHAFLPTIITAEDKASLLVGGLVVVLLGPFFEEIGWTGFATAELRKRHGVLATGLIVGLLWAVWHVPFYAQTGSGPVPPALNVAVIVFFWLLPYRVLMVWVYDHTQSVLLAVLMHVSLNAYTFFLPSPARAGVPDLIFSLVFGATLWTVVAAVTAADRRKLSRGEHTRATPLTHVE